jgi:O-antigen ligase
LLLGLLIGALGATVYAFVQKSGLDWFGWATNVEDRPPSTIGQPNALGAFLVAATSTCAVLPFLVLRDRDLFRWIALIATLAVALGSAVLTAAISDGMGQTVALVAALLIVLAFAGLALAARAGRVDLGRVTAGALVLALIALAFALFFTASRSALVAACAAGAISCVAGALWFVSYRRGRQPTRRQIVAGTVGGLGVAAAVVVAGAIVVAGIVQGTDFGSEVSGRFGASGDFGSEPVGGRISLWRMATQMTLDRPLFGHGQGSFPLLFAEYRDRPDYPGIRTAGVEPESALSLLFDLASTTGVLGVLSFAALVGAVCWLGLRRAYEADDDVLRVAIVAVAAGVVGYLVALLFGFSEAMTSWLFWLLLGALAGIAVGEPHVGAVERTSPRPVGKVVALGASLTLVLLGAITLGWAASLTAADLAAQQALDAVDDTDFAMAVERTERAVRLNPFSKTYLQQEARLREQVRREDGDQVESLRDAIATYDRIIDRFTPLSSDFLGLGFAEFSLAREEGSPPDAALAHIEHAVALDPFNSALRHFVAEFYEREGYEEEALVHRLTVLCWYQEC